jgi:hypothetical protein
MKLQADYLPVHITTYCTLKCRDCGNGIPRFQPPRHSDKGVIIETLKSLFSIFEFTTELRLAGGEAFLHPDICEIALEARKYRSQFERLVIATNATYVPKDEVLRTLSGLDCNFIVNVDDYGALSKKLNELLAALKNYGVKYIMHSYNDDEQYCGGWIDFGMDFSYRNYSPEQLRRTFDVCRKNYYIFDGRMYGCCPASAAYELGLFQPEPHAVVDIIPMGRMLSDIVPDILKLKETPCTVCRYCNGFDVENGKRVKAAVQF